MKIYNTKKYMQCPDFVLHECPDFQIPKIFPMYHLSGPQTHFNPFSLKILATKCPSNQFSGFEEWAF